MLRRRDLELRSRTRCILRVSKLREAWAGDIDGGDDTVLRRITLTPDTSSEASCQRRFFRGNVGPGDGRNHIKPTSPQNGMHGSSISPRSRRPRLVGLDLRGVTFQFPP
ncbi:hypothetical protein VTK26DRAFT_7178 [Humicola hyalothermophila]